jgi:hypothetical protein
MAKKAAIFGLKKTVETTQYVGVKTIETGKFVGESLISSQQTLSTEAQKLVPGIMAVGAVAVTADLTDIAMARSVIHAFRVYRSALAHQYLRPCV